MAPTEASVLILGDTGTGKDLVAHEIHRRSRRKDNPLVRVSALGGIGQRPDLAVPVILNVLEHDSNGMVRRDAAEALGTFANDSDAVLSELTKMLKDPDWQAREGALSGLGKISDKPDVVIPLIVPFLSDENSVIERSAAYALRDLNCRTAYNALVENRNPNIGDIVYQVGEQEKARRKQLK